MVGLNLFLIYRIQANYYIGRTLAIVPRTWNADGYMDLDQDDFKDGDPVQLWQQKIIAAARPTTVSGSESSHRRFA